MLAYVLFRAEELADFVFVSPYSLLRGDVVRMSERCGEAHTPRRM